MDVVRRVVVIDDRRVGLDVDNDNLVFVDDSDTTPNLRRNCEGLVRVEVSVVRDVGLAVVVENLVRSRVNFRLAIAVSETDLVGAAVVEDVNGARVVVGRPLFRGTNAGELKVLVDSVGVVTVVERFFCTLRDGRCEMGRN